MGPDPVDVLVVGAGASGAAFTWSLASSRARIVCLEQGDWPDPAGYPSTGRDWEARQLDDYHFSPNRRRSPADYPVSEADSPIKIANYNAVGGGTVLYAAHFPRMHPSDFRTRSLDGVGEDWPIDYTTLARYYELNERMTGVSGLAGDPAYPPKQPVMPPLPLGRSGRKVAEGFNALGWHWWPSDSAIATERYDSRGGCINLGTCLAGCPQGAKASTDLTYWPRVLRRGVELRPNCRVRTIVVDRRGRATGAHYVDTAGREHFQRAEKVVLACNGVGTPRLLLNSTSAVFPDGLANRSGLVGRNLMFHPYAGIYGVFDEPLDGYKGPITSLMSQEFYETDLARGFVRGYTLEMTRGRAPVATAISGMEQGRIVWGAQHHRAFRRLFNRISGMVAICEDLPEEHNAVTLDPVLTDDDGIPAPKIDYRVSANSRRMLEHAVARGTEVLQAAGAVDVMAQAPLPHAGWHQLGTARMGNDPARSVVNRWGRCHDVENLYIVDGSIFPTSGGVNPTSTIQALALYIADALKQKGAGD